MRYSRLFIEARWMIRLLIRMVIFIMFVTIMGCGKDVIGPEIDEGHPLWGLVINEFMAINNAIISDEEGQFDDWIELYNGTGDSVNIGGLYLSDDINNKIKYLIPLSDRKSTTIPPGGFLLLWADKEVYQGILHVGIKLSGTGEAIVLSDKDGKKAIDMVEFGPQTADVSRGRQTDGDDEWRGFNNPTPGMSNNTLIKPPIHP
jgi:hypothetical protein